METKDTDAIDIITGLAAICVVAPYIATVPIAALPAGLTWLAIRAIRRTKRFEQWVDSVAGKNSIAERTMPYLLPPPKEDESFSLTQHAPLDVRVTNMPQHNNGESWIDRVTRVKGNDAVVGTATKQLATTAKPLTKISTADNMAQVLERMPRHIPYNHTAIPDAPTPMSVLIGYDPIGRKWVWADFGLNGDTIHAFIAGATRAGKDSQIRLWFTQLTANNGPDALQFMIIDSKGEWTTPALKDSRHMFIPPVGGFSLKIEQDTNGKRKLRDLSGEAVEDALITAVEKLQERAELFQATGATNLRSYEAKTGKRLPLLFIVATDVGTNFTGILEKIITFVVLKGGSLGVRAIISMQTASGEDTSWRGQMGLAMSGYQGQASADAPNLGIPVKAMKYRPSELPSVDVPQNRGLFVVRKGIDQYVVRGAYMPDEAFEAYVETHLPKKSQMNPSELLGNLLSESYSSGGTRQMVAVTQQKQLLSKEQAIKAVELAKAGIAPSYITKMLGFTSSHRYAEVMPVVSGIVDAVKAKQRQQGRRA